MPSGEQLAEMEREIIEEHRKDLEALERLKRFLSKSGSTTAESPLRGIQLEDSGGESVDGTDDLTEFLYQSEI